MLKPEQVPDEVVEAFRDAWTQKLNARKAIAAALNAWPGLEKQVIDWYIPPDTVLILPLPTEANDE